MRHKTFYKFRLIYKTKVISYMIKLLLVFKQKICEKEINYDDLRNNFDKYIPLEHMEDDINRILQNAGCFI